VWESLRARAPHPEPTRVPLPEEAGGDGKLVGRTGDTGELTAAVAPAERTAGR